VLEWYREITQVQPEELYGFFASLKEPCVIVRILAPQEEVIATVRQAATYRAPSRLSQLPNREQNIRLRAVKPGKKRTQVSNPMTDQSGCTQKSGDFPDALDQRLPQRGHKCNS